MVTTQPFRGERFNRKVGSVADAIAPPYDVISPVMKEKLRKSSRNITRVILPDNVGRLEELLTDWRENRVLVKDEPSMYVYEQSFVVDGKALTRRGLVCLVGLEDYGKKIILPHERTLDRPKQSRLNLLRYTNTTFGMIFGIYNGEDIITDTNLLDPVIDVSTDGIDHRLWQITDTEIINMVQSRMKEKQVFIADGHHRYETALTHHREMSQARGHPYASDASIMMCLVSDQDSGLVIQPFHRLVHDANIEIDNLSNFYVKKVKPKNFSSKMRKGGIGYFDGTDYRILRLKVNNNKSEAGQLDVSILNDHILREFEVSPEHNIDYLKNMNEALNLVKNDEKYSGVFILNPPTMQQIERVALAGETMPQKSTCFYPKLYTGLVMFNMSDAITVSSDSYQFQP
jgi:uncharacterized protein (DUF1015 family)